MKSIFSFSIFVSLITAVALPSVAQVYSGSVSASTGGAGRAAVVAGDSGFLNPATLPYLRGYYFYSMMGSKEFAVGLSDNTPESIIPAAFSYYQRDSLKDFKLSFADYIGRKWTIGASAHYYQVNQDEKSLTHINADLALAYAVMPRLGFGLIFYNVTGETKNFPDAYKVYPQIGLGTNYIFRDFFRLRADVLSDNNNNFSHPISMFGLESYINKWMLARFGYRDENSTRKQFATAGIGFDLPRFKLNYGYEGEVNDSSISRHSVDLAVPF